jgi:hypothetical protein
MRTCQGPERCALRSDRPKHRRASLRASVCRTNVASLGRNMFLLNRLRLLVGGSSDKDANM